MSATALRSALITILHSSGDEPCGAVSVVARSFGSSGTYVVGVPIRFRQSLRDYLARYPGMSFRTEGDFLTISYLQAAALVRLVQSAG